MSYVHEMIREGWEKTDQAYQAEKHAQLLQVLAGLLAPHLGELIQSKAKSALNDFMLSDELHKTLGRLVEDKVKRAIDDLNARDSEGVRAIVRDELENQSDEFDNRIQELIDEREFIDEGELEDKVSELVDGHLEYYVKRDEIQDDLAEALATFAGGDTMREKIQDALQEMNFSVSVSRY